MSRRVRVAIVSDLHEGHPTAITDPKYQFKHTGGEDPWRDKMSKLQDECWKWFDKTRRNNGPYDYVLANGDLIDGDGSRNGGVELLQPDRQKQAKMAAELLAGFGAKKYVLTYGTAYHTGVREDFEDEVAADLRTRKGVQTVKIGAHEWVDINGCVIDLKHTIGGSNVPYGQFTALAKDRLHNYLWTEHEEQPKAHIIVRSHVHVYKFCGDDTWEAFTTPALQGMGTRFGSRMCSRIVNFGFITLDIDTDGSYTKTVHVARLENQKAKVLKL